MLIIQAFNIHCGGGAVLLSDLIRSLPKETQTTLILDERFNLRFDVSKYTKIIHIKPTLFGRLKADFILKKISDPRSKVICFGSLPPLFKNKGRVFLFIQNKFIIDGCGLFSFPPKIVLRLVLERIWFRLAHHNADVKIVQSQSMQKSIRKHGFGDSLILPFLDRKTLKETVLGRHARFDFIYLASGEPHKNHKILIEAWELLAGYGYLPTLCLTLDPSTDRDICSAVSKSCKKFKLNIINVGKVTNDEALSLLSQSGCLIFPSTVESFGIPLIEADHLGVSVIASEMDFVRDVCEPVETFNPQSAVSVCRSVLRFLGDSIARDNVGSASAFLDRVVSDDLL